VTIKIKRKRFLLEMARSFLSQKVLAEKLGVTPQAVNGFLKERNNIGIETAKKVCDLFNCSFEELFEVAEE
jgi:DNA-binding XRE family transcriptional regulator